MINVIDLFAGCGGLADGFSQTGKFKTLATVDWELPAVNTLKNRFIKKWHYIDRNQFIYFDIQRTEELLNGFMDSKFGFNRGLLNIVGNNKVDLIIGGPPCQAYSIAGRIRDKNGMQDDYRNFLFESYLRLVKVFKPSAFIFENVEGILSAKPGGISIIERIKNDFDEIGYEITNDLRNTALFDTSYFGIPQKRKRIIIFGVKKSDSSSLIIHNFYLEMHRSKQLFPTIADKVFNNLPKIFPLNELATNKKSHYVEDSNGINPLNHEPRFHNARDIKIFRLLANDILNKTNLYSTTKSLIDLYEKETGKKTNVHKYHVIREDKPSNVIPAHLYKDGLRHIHPDPNQARTITVREAARIQSFDDDFEFLGAKGAQYKMIGNAVPPKFSKIIAENILKTNLF